MMEIENIESKYCKLTFDCYDFYKLIDCLSGFLDECQIELKETPIGEMQIRAMDVSRICLLDIKKEHITVDKGIKVILDFDDLAKILKCAKADKKELIIDFDTEQVTNYKIKHLNKSMTKKVLKTLDIETEVIPIENLMSMVYPSYVQIRKTYLSDFFKESEGNFYSDIVEIKIDSEGITFSQGSIKGSSEFSVDKDNLYGLRSDHTCVERGKYSLIYLNNLKKLLSILENTDTIKISLKENHPLRIEVYLDSLDIQLTMFLAPRVEEAEFDDEDDYNDEETIGLY